MKPDQPNDQDKLSQIVLRVPREKKGRYVQAARARGQSLGTWCEGHLDAALLSKEERAIAVDKLTR